MYNLCFKRFLDFTLSLLALIVLSPVLLIVAILVRIKLGSPILFTQKRPGKDENIFKMYKFRTMSDERDEQGNLLSDEIRLTSFGKLLRSTSLDELPELINILKGDIALCGPRPQLVRDMMFMSEEQRKRHDVRPGLTGLAQVNGRNNITWEEKFKYDLKYINEGITLLGDVKIIFKTILKVIKRSDITREGTVSDMDLGDWLLQKDKINKKIYEEKQAEAVKVLTQN